MAFLFQMLLKSESGCLYGYVLLSFHIIPSSYLAEPWTVTKRSKRE